MTYFQYFNHAKQCGYDWADDAINNCKEQKTINKKCPTNNPRHAIAHAFSWKLTNNEQYWVDLFMCLPDELAPSIYN